MFKLLLIFVLPFRTGVFVLEENFVQQSSFSPYNIEENVILICSDDTVCTFSFSGFIASAAVVQKKVLETFTAGETITLDCLISQDYENYLSWFKQSLGEAPTCILSLYADSLTPTFYGDFKNDKRFTVLKQGIFFSLTINDAKPSDSGIYYCGARDYDLITLVVGCF